MRVGRLGIHDVHLVSGSLSLASVRVFRQIKIATVIVVLLGFLLRLLGLEWISAETSSRSVVCIRLLLGKVKLDVTRLHNRISTGSFISLVRIESANRGRITKTQSLGSWYGSRRLHWWRHESNSRGRVLNLLLLLE